MGCIFGCDQPYDDDDDIYIRDNHHRHHHHHHNHHNHHNQHHRSHRRVVPYYSYCLNCRCEQYDQVDRSSNKCICGHSPIEHKTI
ncbi:unnamed protein product [Rotaria sp. Silwood1]|nr:unnamed protein product [Rotaria sp. Silwood1]CAF1547022.1 unnamed protein product [Rotaria sp. Silwood1]CAF1558177.1 unnamed protein product [Rotaria sp. Silwood1]CAF3672741.1 unnamed protein product [Rotaria sp. Silwood1]CAF3727251.1 unnamed protein product [Rotaria sp. Silwood1]